MKTSQVAVGPTVESLSFRITMLMDQYSVENETWNSQMSTMRCTTLCALTDNLFQRIF